jgi:hypothetical protein
MSSYTRKCSIKFNAAFANLFLIVGFHGNGNALLTKNNIITYQYKPKMSTIIEKVIILSIMIFANCLQNIVH